MGRGIACLAGAAVWGIATVLATPVVAQPLITAEEAKLPPPKGAIAVTSRGITRGPRIEFVQPGPGAASPMRFAVRFESFGGAAIDLNSVKVTYLRSPNVDLTPRLKAFMQPTGIDMPNAELPAGEHALRVDLQDSGGRTATANFTLKVAN